MTRAGTIALIGKPNVGKSSILNKILGQKIAATTHKPQTTRRRLRGVHTEGDTQLVFVDTPGVHEAKAGLHAFMVEEALDSARGVDVIALVVEPFIKKGAGVEIDHRDQEVLKLLPEGVPVVLVVNKVDRVEKSEAQALAEQWAELYPFRARAQVSAHTGRGINKLLEKLGKLAPEGEFLFPEGHFTDESERAIAAELIREKAMLELKEEIPYSLAVEIEEWDEDQREDKKKPLVHIEATIHVERDAHKRIVIGKGGERIKAIGTRARKDLEYLLDCQVMLKLFVHTEPNWTQKAHQRRRFGYG